MIFSSDASANLEGLLDVSREICAQQMAEKASPDAPPFCAGVPKLVQLLRDGRKALRIDLASHKADMIGNPPKGEFHLFILQQVFPERRLLLAHSSQGQTNRQQHICPREGFPAQFHGNGRESEYATVITIGDDGSDAPVRKYHRVEKVADIEVLEFDSEGLISPELARILDPSEGHLHHSFQIRLPYIKGVVHEVDFRGLFSELGVDQIVDVWGNRLSVDEVELILTKSMFKGYGWMTENGLTFGEYLACCRKYDHALYVSGMDKGNTAQNGGTSSDAFSASCTCKSLDLRPVSLRDLQAHLTKNSFACRPPYLCGIA